ncbi:MAG: nitrous oxide-stimulated promoter family protein [bacterium]|jgi:hypothetical protein
MQFRFASSWRTRIKPPREALDRDLVILHRFVGVYCRKNHGTEPRELCDECAALYDYARRRRECCPFNPKPKCKDCPAHCYKPAMRKRIKEVMRFSGIYFVKRGRVDWLIKYFF